MLYGGFSNVEQLKSCKITSKYDDDIDMDARIVEFEFHRASEVQVRTHSEFEFLPFFEFKVKFGDEFSKFWPKCFEPFKFYQV